jgi:N-sulfoglucosamine sulfohydrolase
MAEACYGFIDATNVFSLESDTRPFFLYFCPNDSHRSKYELNSNYLPNTFGNRSGGYEGIIPVVYEPDEVIVPPFLPDSAVCRAELAQYYQSVSRSDQGIGRLLQILKETGEYENTLIVFVSDHGICFPGGKTTLYEPGMRTPCIVKSPYQREGGVVSNGMISWVDIVPTILDFADIAPERLPEFHGRSFRSILTQEDPIGWDRVFASHTFHEITMYYPMRVVRERRYKLIWNIAWELEFPQAADLWQSPTWREVVDKGRKYFGKRTAQAYLQRPQFELYDLRNDPNEINNLAENPNYGHITEELKTKLKAFQMETGDPWVLKWGR